MVGVALDLGVEEVDGGGLGLKELLGVVEVLAGLGDVPCGVIVPLLVWWPATMCRGWRASTLSIASRHVPKPPTTTL
jgi:hypothetical protein